MTDTLEWDGGEAMELWYLRDMRDSRYPDMRVKFGTGKEALFYVNYKSASYVMLPKPDGMSIDQIKDWALSQFLLMKES